MKKLGFAMFLLGMWIGGFIMLLKSEATKTSNYVLVEQGHAYFHPKTGAFTLRECKE